MIYLGVLEVIPPKKPPPLPCSGYWKGGQAMNKPTVKQINFAKDLLEQLGKEDEYDFLEIVETWTREEVSELIDSLLALRDERKRR